MDNSTSPSYFGRILGGSYSPQIQNDLLKKIQVFKTFDALRHPAIPYISAWRNQSHDIWYEYAGRKLAMILGCRIDQCAHNLRNRIVDRHIYKSPHDGIEVAIETLKRHELEGQRRKLRHQGRLAGNVDAVYKIACANKRHLWLKDQAKIVYYPHDHVCLSYGLLIPVSNEMRAEENLQLAQQKLRQHHDILEETVKLRTEELWRTQLEVVYRLARAAEFRDKQTGRHISKMSKYCAILGYATGIDKKLAKLLYHAAPMHDVGKIAISDKILLKPGRLTPGEYDLMKTHSEIGANLLAGHDSKLLRLARVIALSHHERWDGSGYPLGLAGRKIPLAGRISAICDVFDALTSKRPYKRAISFEEAVFELQKGSGSHFDPDLVRIFLNHLPRMKYIHDNGRFKSPSTNRK